MKIVGVLIVIILAVLVLINFYWNDRPDLSTRNVVVDKSYSENLLRLESEVNVSQPNLPRLEIVNDPNSPSILPNQEGGDNSNKNQTISDEDNQTIIDSDESPIKSNPSSDLLFR